MLPKRRLRSRSPTLTLPISARDLVLYVDFLTRTLVLLASLSFLYLRRIANTRQDGVHTGAQPGETPRVQICRRRQVLDVQVHSEAILYTHRDQMLPHVHGAQCHHPQRLQLRYRQPPNHALLQPDTGHGLSSMGLPVLVDWLVPVSDI